MVGLLLRLLELNRIFNEKCRLLFSILQSSETLETSGIINRAIFSASFLLRCINSQITRVSLLSLSKIDISERWVRQKV